MLNAHKKIAISQDVEKNNIFVLENGDNLIINSTKAKKIPPEKIIDEVVLRDNPSYSNQIDSNIYEHNIISIIINSREVLEKKDINIKIFDKSNNINVKQSIEDFILKNNLNNNSEGWSEITKQFNNKIYKLILEKFNKKYVIKSIFIEK